MTYATDEQSRLRSRLRDTVDGYEVSTIRLPACVFEAHMILLGGGWESAIKHDGCWEVVGRYMSEKLAMEGHNHIVDSIPIWSLTDPRPWEWPIREERDET